MTTLALVALARALYLAARSLGDSTGVPPSWRPDVHRGQWRVRHEPSEGWRDLHTLTLARLCDCRGPHEEGCYTEAVMVGAPIRCGRVVLVPEWSPDGGGVLYVLDAREEVGDG